VLSDLPLDSITLELSSRFYYVDSSVQEMEDVELAAATDYASANADSANDDVDSDKEPERSIILQWLFSPKLWIGLLLLGFIMFVVVDTATTGYVRDGVVTFLDWIEENPIPGFFLFVIGEKWRRQADSDTIPCILLTLFLFFLHDAVYLVATVLFIPGSILTLGAGFVFSSAFGLGAGVALGTISVFIGASIGAILSFLLGRYLLREQVGKLSKKYAIFEALDLALQENGLKIFLLLRLSPIIPFNVINYIGGVSSVSFGDYVLALFAILPGTILYIFLGASAGSLADSAESGSNPTVTIVIVVVGIVFGILAIWVTTRYARKELNRVLAQRQAQDADHQENVEEQAEDDNNAWTVEDNSAGSANPTDDSM
jgi:uncharacterized membrane protein YdjX (TVP38/TMEM64 family)